MSQRRAWAIAILLTLALVTAGSAVSPIVRAQGGTQVPADKWLHVTVNSKTANGETVRVNVPLSLIEKVLPAINKDKLHSGKIRINECRVEGVDLRAVLEAVKGAKDGEFVTVEGPRENVRVAKENGYLIVKVRDMKRHRAKDETPDKAGQPVEERVDVKIPFSVVEALLSGANDELDLVAAIRALAAHGDSILVSVEDHENTVRVWVDSKNTGQ
jgi:hypothetical protein